MSAFLAKFGVVLLAALLAMFGFSSQWGALQADVAYIKGSVEKIEQTQKDKDASQDREIERLRQMIKDRFDEILRRIDKHTSKDGGD